jgi:hypothetical protein
MKVQRYCKHLKNSLAIDFVAKYIWTIGEHAIQIVKDLFDLSDNQLVTILMEFVFCMKNVPITLLQEKDQ